MATFNTNNPREDSIFATKVKGILLRDGGDAGMVNALSDFETRDAKAKEDGQPGLSLDEFIDYLTDNGVTLTSFEQNYLSKSFEDVQNKGYISAQTFVRHLTGMNHRRMKAVEQAWEGLEKDSEGKVPRATLVNTHSRTAKGGNTAGFDSTFGGGGTLTRSQRTGTGETVSHSEFVALYAAESQRAATDEAFTVSVLREWGADKTTAPKMSETQREWEEETGDPLAKEPKLVGDALHHDLGVSGKTYNYMHMQREHPPVEPLPPLNRQEIMSTTTQQTFQPHSEEDRTYADPLASRRGQLQ